MAKGASTSSTMTFICLFMFILNFHSSHGEDQELELLLSFKASIHDPLHFLSNWVTSSAAATTTLCKWHGITCSNNSSHVNTLVLSGKNITGEVSSSIFQLPYISNLDLSNNQLVGEITLTNHSLSSYSLSPIRHLNLSNNNLTGSLPQFLFSVSFSDLETLDLSNNMFSGIIPNQIGVLSNLRYLDIGGNVLVGKIPTSITNITTLQYLTLASNQLVGEIPKEIRVMKSLKWIYFGYNNLSGEIPSSIGNLFSLNHLDLVYNNLTGPIPQSLGHLTQLQYLFVYQNKLTGPIPLSIFELKNLVSLDLSDNSLSGEIPEIIIQLQKLEILHLFSNNLTGNIPKSIASLPKLEVLQLWSNKLTGEIPEELGKHGNLTVLDLSTNNLTGKIPNTLCDSHNLFKLILFSNLLEGAIPHSLTTCTTLRRVRLQNNKLSGKLPSELTKLPQIYFFDISGNQLSGRIDDREWNMPSLQMLSLANNNFSGQIPNSFGTEKLEALDLSRNRFSGSIPTGFEKSPELVQLKLSNNNLIGEIPPELCWCKKLVVLDLGHNQFSGQIPAKLAELPVLGLLDVSENQLSGEIPQNLGSMESLVQVNVSHNHLRGSLPSTGAFLGINASAVTGNDLCEHEMNDESSSGLPRCKSGSQSQSWLLIMLCFVSALVAFAAVSLTVFVVRRRRRTTAVRKVESEDGTWEMRFYDRVVKVEEVLAAVREGKTVTCEGRNGYVGLLMVNETGELRYWEERVGRVGHENIVKVVGTVRNGKRGYLLYEQNVEWNKLKEILNGLSWERRVKIALGVAKAIQFLHSSMLLVGDVSSLNVWVDAKGVPRVKVLPPGITPCLDTKGFVSSPYVAPHEARKSAEIYGFGVMLIELLTGRSAMDVEAGNGIGIQKSIVEWAQYCYSDCHLDTWIDPVIKGGDALTYQNDIVQTMNLALRCTATDPTARPCVRDVLKALRTLRSNTTTFC